ncbi:ATP-binding protein [Nonomuraea sp. NPDC049504]|uniref:ATP-binding protein n=1 Tax=Nonomuraea sp. NPDC049504 TaxID=3154729 RepID=UPI00341ED83A
MPEQVVEHVLAVLREALSNVAGHSHATRAEVSVEVGNAALTLVVTDNGVGVGEQGRRSGLRNIEERTGRLGGTPG